MEEMVNKCHLTVPSLTPFLPSGMEPASAEWVEGLTKVILFDGTKCLGLVPKHVLHVLTKIYWGTWMDTPLFLVWVT